MKQGLTKIRVYLASLAVIVIALNIDGSYASKNKILEKGTKLPEFTQTAASQWINSPPKKVSDFSGKVVMLDVWTYSCWNCYRSFPWQNQIEKRYEKQGFQIIGIHSPEFEHEKERASVEQKAKEFDLHHPIMMDNDFAYWNALANRYWPAFYLVDKGGNIRYVFVGETHADTPKAKRIEQAIEELLAEMI